jgi:hypothetical protein
MTIFKAFSTAFFVMCAVILIICFMEVGDELKHNDFMLYGIMLCVAITGCIGAAVSVNMINSKG